MKKAPFKLDNLYSGVWWDDCSPFCDLLKNPSNVDVAKTPDELKADSGKSALIIWGGADINPEYYNHPLHSTTHPGGTRDRLEWALMQRAIEIGMPIIGVCRGAQMACAAAGGFLIQDVKGHHGHHWVHTWDNDVFNVNSIHHQMMAGLEKTDHELVAWNAPAKGAKYGYMDDKWYEPPEGWKEPEFVYFKKIQAYAIQWHPEMMPVNSPATQYVLKYILNKEEKKHDGYSYRALDCAC